MTQVPSAGPRYELLSSGRAEQVVGVRETEDFLAAVRPRQVEAGTALHNGDPGPWTSLWSQEDPVNLFGAGVSRTATSSVAAFNERLGSWFQNCSSYEVELVAAGASGDFAYTVAYEKTTASVRSAAASRTRCG